MVELGGSDAYAILADCDLEQAATAVVDARVSNTGQTCIAPKRAIVEKSVKARSWWVMVVAMDLTIQVYKRY